MCCCGRFRPYSLSFNDSVAAYGLRAGVGALARHPACPAEATSAIKLQRRHQLLLQLQRDIPFEMAGGESVERLGDDGEARPRRQKAFIFAHRIGADDDAKGIRRGADAPPDEDVAAQTDKGMA